ncbi:MAG: Arc family DNA binding domain-containing protein [Marinilabiliales bacterium]|nr:MAG: Arc family DNA binding domain-containing protein [Marinilabiliales bacterium]
MTKKKSFALRLDPAMLSSLEKWAADEFRSTNGQIEWILARALRDSGRLKKTNKETEDGKTDEV